MKSGSLLKLAVVLAGLAALCGVFGWLAKPARRSEFVPASLVPRIARIELSGPDGNCVLIRASGGWKMESPIDYPVNSNDLNDALDKLPKISLSDQLTTDTGRLDLFGLSQSSATFVRMFTQGASKPEIEFYLGKDGSDWDSFFLRFSGQGAVLAQGLPGRDLRKSVGDWLSKDVTHLPTAQVTRLAVASKSGRIELKETGDRWSLVAPARALSTGTVEGVVRPAVSAAAELEADRVLPASQAPALDKMGLSKPELTIELAGPSTVVLKVGAKDSQGDRYVEKAGENRVYFLVPDWKFDALRKKELAKIRSLKEAKT